MVFCPYTLTAHHMALPLEFAFTISRSTKTVANTVRVELTYHTGGEILLALGEAVPSSYYGEDWQTVLQFYQKLIEDGLFIGLEPHDQPELERRLAQYKGHMAAKAGLEIAFWDLRGKLKNQPLYELWGHAPSPMPKTSYTIGIDDEATVRHKTTLALQRGYDIIKIKLGGPADVETVRIIREMAPHAAIRLDANAGWTLAEALKKLEQLAPYTIEFVEEPLVLPSPERDYVQLKIESPIPLMADESCHTLKDISRCAALFHSINLKHTKTGGLAEAKRMIESAHHNDLQVMLGGFAETRISVTAFAHLAPLVAYADLDACLLIANDPYDGLVFEGSRMTLPNRPGIGVIAK